MTTNQTIDGVPLLPCPFCGELPVITKHFKHEMYSLMHRCPVIGPISRDFRETAQGHIDMWNTRVEQPAPVAVPRLEMAHVVRAHMEIPGCPVLTSNQCYALAMKLNESLNPSL